MSKSTIFNEPETKRPADARDRRLLHRVAEGDRNAMTELYNQYFPRLFTFLYRLSSDYCMTEEVVNDVLFIVWRNADKFQGSSKVSTWILGIGYRQCAKRLRKKRFPQADRKMALEPVVNGCSGVELDDVITKALAELSPNHRMVIECVLYLGMTYREVAVIVDCPVNTAKTRVHNARKKLKVALSRLGYVGGAQDAA